MKKSELRQWVRKSSEVVFGFAFAILIAGSLMLAVDALFSILESNGIYERPVPDPNKLMFYFVF